MIDPWEIRSNVKRESDQIPNFIIFCEDQVCEPLYFKYFETPKIKINTIPGQKSKQANVVNAILHCINSGLMDPNLEIIPSITNDVHIWCVFDRDLDDTKPDHSNIEFDLAISSALEKKLKVAWSNDAFELWILLHFEEVNPENIFSQKRTYYYNRLTDIFKRQEIESVTLQRIKKSANFNYKTDLKKTKRFQEIVNPQIHSKTEIAIERAKKLNSFHSEKSMSKRSPCTLVYELVEEIIRLR